MTHIAPEPGIWHFDGRSATRHHPALRWSADGLKLEGEGWSDGPFPWSSLIALGAPKGESLYGLKGQSGWRLGFAGPPPEAFSIHLPLPMRYGRLVDRLGLPKAIGAFTLAAAGVVALAMSAPAWIGPRIPITWENKLGDVMVGDFGGRICSTPQGRAALDAMAKDVGVAGTPVRAIEVVNVDMVNAVALPGGRILLFQGLLDKADSADEVAGVLGHEIGHVVNRDMMVALVRQLGLSVVLGGLNGDIGGTVNSALAMRFSREAESEADNHAIGALARARISPEGTASFFDRLSGGKTGEQAERTMSWLASHPVSAERRDAFRKSKKAGINYRPALDEGQWNALKSMCAQDKDVVKETDWSPF
jgi:beta-barrel assembly-enhancing protease